MSTVKSTSNTSKIVPHLWFDKDAKTAADFYVSALGHGSKVENVVTLHNTPGGDCDVVTFELRGQVFQAINGGPMFKPNPSVSFLLWFDPSKDEKAEEQLQELWKTFSKDGSVLMPLQEYPFSKLYGWIQDKWGVTWQMYLAKPGSEARPFVMPSLKFVGPMCGKAEEASTFYQSIFKNSRQGTVSRYPAGREPNKEGTIMYCDFCLDGQWISAMDSGTHPESTFNEAISLVVNCEDQKEINYFWGKLSAVPESEQCGWLKDKFGVSWQIIPNRMEEMMRDGTAAQIDSVTQSLLPMKKIIIADLETAYAGKEAPKVTKRKATDELGAEATKKHKTELHADEAI